MAGRASISAKCIVSSLVIYAEITLVWTLHCAVLLCNVEFRWKITLLFVYMLNLWLHMQTPHYRSYRAGTRNMMLTFDSCPIYRALTYIAVPFLGPQQPRYIGLTLYSVEKYNMKFHAAIYWQWQKIGLGENYISETETISLWSNFWHWLLWKLSFWQFLLQWLMKVLSQWHFLLTTSGKVIDEKNSIKMMIFPFLWYVTLLSETWDAFCVLEIYS